MENNNDIQNTTNKGNEVLADVTTSATTSAPAMPCGSNHSCLDCIHSVMITRPCSYLSRMEEGEVDAWMDKLRVK